MSGKCLRWCQMMSFHGFGALKTWLDLQMAKRLEHIEKNRDEEDLWSSLIQIFVFTCRMNLKKDGFARVLRGCLLKLSTGADGSQGLVNAHRVWPRSVWTLSLQAVLLWLSKPNLVGESCWNQETGNWNAWMCAHAHERKYGTEKHTNAYTHTYPRSWRSPGQCLLLTFELWGIYASLLEEVRIF